ncbi:unnamed protein product [Thelazia callipaeda]|uniref:Pre-rRNA-processing protein TSR1 homolog n=1 Tax=Thelazia callipaeda TaxID=103827 RepID=A0A0N5CQ81_THECL|nr:unnamed protein product [Thelazia callipaeda]
MEAKNVPSISDKASSSSLKVKKTCFKTKYSKIERLVHLYKNRLQLRSAIKRLEDRPVSCGEDYDEDLEEAYERRLIKLANKRLQIHNYLTRKGIFVVDTAEKIVSDAKPKLIISTTGVEHLNLLLTEHINQEIDSEVFGIKIRLPYRHVTLNDVKLLIEKAKDMGSSELFPVDPSALGKFLIVCRDEPFWINQMVQNVVCEVNRVIKKYIEDNHKMSLADCETLNSEEAVGNGTSKSDYVDGVERGTENSSDVPTWDCANIVSFLDMTIVFVTFLEIAFECKVSNIVYVLKELHEAYSRGELDCQEPESSGDIDDTEMLPTSEEDEEEQEYADFEPCAPDSPCKYLNCKLDVQLYVLKELYEAYGLDVLDCKEPDNSNNVDDIEIVQNSEVEMEQECDDFEPYATDTSQDNNIRICGKFGRNRDQSFVPDVVIDMRSPEEGDHKLEQKMDSGDDDDCYIIEH